MSAKEIEKARKVAVKRVEDRAAIERHWSRDYTCACGLYVNPEHPASRKPAIHIPGCLFEPVLPTIKRTLDEGPDVIARRLILNRQLWDRITALAGHANDGRGVADTVFPMDVAAVALALGVAQLEREVQ